MKSILCTALALLLLLTIGFAARASGEAVAFADANMERMVREQLGKAEGPITSADVSGVESLNLSQPDGTPDTAKIRDLSGLEHFRKLKSLNIMNNLVEGISPLAQLMELEELEAPKNLIADLSPLSGLPKIRHAVFWENRVADLSPVAGLVTLEVFSVTNNQVSDVSPLRGLTNLFCLELLGNPIADFGPIMNLLPNIKFSDGFQASIQGQDSTGGKPKPEQAAGEAVVFIDANLERMVREQLGKADGPITAADVEGIEYLSVCLPEGAPDGDKIRDLSGLEHFRSLKSLNIGNNLVEDLGPISQMWELEELEAPMNRISDLGPVGGLPKVRHAVFWKNRIEKLDPVANLKGLEVFSVTDNLVRDVSPLQGLNKLDWLELRGNFIIDFSPIRDILPNLSGTDGFAVTMPEDKISFNDPVLEQRVRKAMGKPDGDITVGDALKMSELALGNPWQESIPSDTKIRDISALKYFANLFKLELFFHDIQDISVVRYMPMLGILDLNGNKFYDLAPVSGLSNLKMLNIGGWEPDMPDLSPLAGLTGLEWLNISHSKVTSIEPLRNLTNLIDLFAVAAIEDFSPISGHAKLRTLHILNGVPDKYSPDLTTLKDIYPNLTDRNFEL